jgi:hypothetical protein
LGGAFCFRAVDSAKLAIETLIAPICIGQDATLIRPLMPEVQKKLHVFGRGGALARAGISPDDLMIKFYELPGENISFGQGVAQRAFVSQAT